MVLWRKMRVLGWQKETRAVRDAMAACVAAAQATRRRMQAARTVAGEL